MAAAAATSAVKGRLTTLRRGCSFFSRSPNLQTDEAFVKQRVLENLQVSTVNEVELCHHDKPIFFSSRHTTDIISIETSRRCAALSLKDDGNVSQKYDIYPPIVPFRRESLDVCNDILCFYNNKRDMFLWNPTTNESKILPQSPAEDSPDVSKYIDGCGIWIDDKSQDYKVMRAISYVDLKHRIDSYNEIELYSLKTDSWKKISCEGFTFNGPHTACINGVHYMKAQREDEANKVILTFDFSTETVSYLPLPDIEAMTHYCILDYKGLLSILSLSSYETETLYDHWVMRNGSWCRLSVFHTRNVEYPLGFSRNGELLYFNGLYDSRLVFDSATGKLKHLDGWETGRLCCLRVFPFSESFVILKEHEKNEDGPVMV